MKSKIRVRGGFRLSPALLPGIALLWSSLAVQADVKLPVMTTRTQTYSNVTITSVSATDVFFTHAHGMGNVKLKDLEPDLQKRFQYDAAKATAAADKQSAANAEYHKQLAAQKPPAAKSVEPEPEEEPPGPVVEIPGPKIKAKAFLGQPAPAMQVEQWLTPPPDTTGKFVLVEFWATWCGPCLMSIPHLNSLAEKFGDRLVVVGLTYEPEQKVLRVKSPKMRYSVATDTQRRMQREVQVSAIPHAMLMDPDGIVRYEGHPALLKDAMVETLLKRWPIND